VTTSARDLVMGKARLSRVCKDAEDEIGVCGSVQNDIWAELRRREEALEESKSSLAHEVSERQK